MNVVPLSFTVTPTGNLKPNTKFESSVLITLHLAYGYEITYASALKLNDSPAEIDALDTSGFASPIGASYLSTVLVCTIVEISVSSINSPFEFS